MLLICLLAVSFLCDGGVSAQESASSTVGREFYVGIPLAPSGLSPVFEVMIGTPFEEASYAIQSSTADISQGTVSSSGSTTIELDSSFEVTSSGFSERAKGLRIYSTGDNPISVLVGIRYSRFFLIGYGAYLVHPNSEFQGVDSYEYFAVSTDYAGATSITDRFSNILLVGNEDGTIISITPTQTVSLPVDAQSESALVEVAAGSTHAVTLQRLQTLGFSSLLDLSGTRIVSSKPITVLSGHQCAQVPTTVSFCEPLYVHIPPTVNWGQLFLLAPLGGRTSAQQYKLVTSENSTAIAYRCGTDNSQGLQSSTRGNSHIIAFAADSYCYLTASKPVFVVQVALGFGADNTGDPAVAIISPVVGHVKSTSFLASPSGNFPDNFITVTVLAEHFTATQIHLDGSQLDCTWTDIFNLNDDVVGHGCTASIQPGTHVVSHEGENGVLSVVVCGWGGSRQLGYAYLTGINLQVPELPTQVPEVIFDELLTYFDLSGVPDVKELSRQPDSHSGPIFIPGSIIYGDEIIGRIFVNENGAFSFNDPWMYAHPNRYPTNYLPSRQRHVLSPFWSDVDIRKEGTIRYVTINRESSVRGDMILEETATYFNDRFGDEDVQQSFEPTWMIVAQWEGVHPYPHGSDDLEGLDQEYLSRTNTFQGVLITNNTQSFYGFSYACGDIQWSGQGFETAIVGYNSLADYFFNHPANGVPDIGRIVSCTRQIVSAGGRKKRQTVANNEPANGPLPCNAEVKAAVATCMGLANLDKQSFPDVNAIEDVQNRKIFEVLPACPPTLALVTLSPLFQPHPDQTRNCYQSNARFIPFRPGGLLKPYEFVSVCCYDDNRNDAVIGEGAEAGRILDVTGSSYDEDFRSNCCNYGHCEEYLNQRPTVPIADPGQTRCASASGDPHYRTFDGIVHHFLNGDNRHYFLMRVTTDQGNDVFYLQGHLQYTPWRATTTKSLAFGVPGSYGYQFVSNDQPVIHRTFPGPAVQMTSVDNSDVKITLENRGNGRVLCRVDFLQLRMRLDATFVPSGQSYYINYGMCVADDVCRASVGHLGSCIDNQGSAIPTVNDHLITQDQSFFMEPIIAGRRKRQAPGPAPELADLTFTDEERELCNNDESCLYDLVVTGNNEVALVTRDASEESQRLQLLIANSPPNFTSDATVFRVNVREENIYSFSVTDTNAFNVSIEGGAPQGSSLSSDGNGMYTFKWTPTDVPTRELSFIAVDSLGAASTLTPFVQVCACFNGGECTLQGVLSTDRLIQNLTCLCTEAYSGDTCSEDRNGCAEIECFRGVECLDVPAPGVGAVCGACGTGFTGDGLKCTDLDECAQDDALCDQICNNTFGSFVCSCEPGFTLVDDNCEDIDECATANDCQQICVNNEGSFECMCVPGFILDTDGRKCNPRTTCGAHPCSHICAIINGVEECSCPAGLELAQGSATDCVDVNECDQFSPCDQVCTNSDGSFMCSCNPGYQLDDVLQICEDIDECRMAILDGTVICMEENSECFNIEGSFDCVCVGGYRFVDGECQRIPDEVIEPPDIILPALGEENSITFVVQIGGIEELTVSRFQEFRVVTAAAITRYCRERECTLVTFEGEIREFSVTVRPEHIAVLTGNVMTDADGNPLLTFYAQLATDRVVAASVLMAALEDAIDLYSEARFLDLDECEMDNGGCAEICINTEGSFECACSAGFILADDGRSCSDIDECASGSECDSNAACTNTPGSFSCACNPGYTGDGVTCIDVDECAIGDSCDLNAICTNTVGSFTCACNPGFTGDGATCTDVDECADGLRTNCDINAACTNTPGGFSCACNPGYTGDGVTCTDLDECAVGSDDCDANAFCTNTLGSFSCTCLQGYLGDGRICTDIDECAAGTDNCDSNAACINFAGTFTCACNPGYTGNGVTCTDIDECAADTDSCDSNADCTNTAGSFTCSCNTGFSGDGITCTDIDECASADNCDINADCTNTVGSFFCSCNPGFIGDGFVCADVDECADGLRTNCDINAACTNTPGGFSCACNPGYTGDGVTCTDLDECAVGSDDCDANAFCTNTLGSFSCTCLQGYLGDGRICTDIDECAADTDSCDSNADCTNTAGSFTCSCNTGFSGDGITCTDIDECASANNCDINADCTNTVGGFFCSCNPGFTGDGFACADVDECADGLRTNCDINAACTNTPGGFSCACNPGYTGDGVTCTDLDECAVGSDDCDANAFCTNTLGSFSCTCLQGYLGDGRTCTDIDECAAGTDNCDSNAACINFAGTFTCACNPGYTGNGVTCTDIDECAVDADNCDINADCINTAGSFTCACITGFSGDGVACTDIDECAAGVDNCDTNAACINIVGDFICTCNTGFTGDGVTCSDIDACQPNRCAHICEDIAGSPQCSCRPGYTLAPNNRDCEDIDECATDFGGCQQRCVNTEGSFRCSCMPDYILATDNQSCIQPDRPLRVILINSSPRTSRNITFVDFITSKPVRSARCDIATRRGTSVDCSSGTARFFNLSPGYHRVRIVARATTGELQVLRRTIFICSEGSCGASLINVGVTVMEDCARIEFTSCGPVESYWCRLDREPFELCRSPLRYCGLEPGRHRFRVFPTGRECGQIGRLITDFRI